MIKLNGLLVEIFMENSNYLFNETDFYQQLARFARVLRGLGVRVSTAEVLDAVRTLAVIDITDREQFRIALASTMIKRKQDLKLFDLAFRSFFATPEEKESYWQQQEEKETEEKNIVEEAEKDLANSIMESGGRWAGKAQEYLDLSLEQKETLAKMPSEERARLKQTIESFAGNPINDPSSLIAGVVEASLNYWRYYLAKQEKDDENYQSIDLKIQYTGQEEIDRAIYTVSENYNQSEEISLLHKDMQDIAGEELTGMTKLVEHFSKKLATHISRRYQRSNNRNKIDIRRTIRKSIAYGGVPVKLAYRSKIINRARLVVLCDVSASMVNYARFIIQFLYGLAYVIKSIEIFIYAEDVEKITQYFSGDIKFSDTMTTIMKESRQWGKTTDLSTALFYLDDKYKHIFSPGAYFVIISDTKTQQAGNAAKKIQKLRGRVKDILWLNTLPAKEWEFTYTVDLFKEHTRMVECNTMAKLEKALSKNLL